MYNKKEILEEIAVTTEGIEPTGVEQEQIVNTATSDILNGTDVQEQNNIDDNTSEEQSDEGYIIDGEVFTPDEIKEWRQGYLRQSDYTKKTQALSQEKQKIKDAMELYDYLQTNPDVAQQLAQQDKSISAKAPTPDNKAINELSYRLASMELDAQLNNIKAKDSNVDEVELLNIATQHGCSIDIAYNIYRGMNFDKILEQRLKEQSSKLTEEIKTNGNITKTLISNADKNNDKGNFGLSNDEVIMATKLGMSLEEYSKWK